MAISKEVSKEISIINSFFSLFLPVVHLYPRNGVSTIEGAKVSTENWVSPNIA